MLPSLLILLVLAQLVLGMLLLLLLVFTPLVLAMRPSQWQVHSETTPQHPTPHTHHLLDPHTERDKRKHHLRTLYTCTTSQRCRRRTTCVSPRRQRFWQSITLTSTLKYDMV